MLDFEEFSETEKRVEALFEKFVQNEVNLLGLSNEKTNLTLRIKAFAGTWSSLSSEQKKKQSQQFIENEFKMGNLPLLTNDIKKQTQSIVNKIQAQIQNQGIELVRAKASKHLGGPNEATITNYIYSIAFDCAAYYQQHKKSPYFKSIPLSSFKNVSTDVVKKYYNKELFEYNNKTQALDLKVSKKELEAVSLSWIFKNFGFPGHNFIYKGAVAGMLIELFIMFWLAQNPVCNLFFDPKLNYRTIGLKNFVHFYSIKQKKNMRQSLKHMVEEAMKNKYSYYCIGKPVTAQQLKKGEKGQVDTSPNSPSFDLLLLRYFDKKVEITTIDFTVNQKQEQIEKKKNQAQDLIQELLQYNYQRLLEEIGPLDISNWTHIVACKKQVTFEKQIKVLWDYNSMVYPNKLKKAQIKLDEAKQELEKAKKEPNIEDPKTEVQRRTESKEKVKELRNKSKAAKENKKQGRKANPGKKTKVEIKAEEVTKRCNDIAQYQSWIKKAKEMDKEGMLFKTNINIVSRDICQIQLIKDESGQSPMSLEANQRLRKLLFDLEKNTEL